MNCYLLLFLNMLLPSLIFMLHDLQTGNKTSGDNFLNHEIGQGGNDLPRQNGDDENGQKEKGDKI